MGQLDGQRRLSTPGWYRCSTRRRRLLRMSGSQRLAYAIQTASLEDARDLGRCRDAAHAPSETKLSPSKGSPTVSNTFKQRDRKLQKTQLVLEPLRSPFEPYHVVGLRLHVFLYEAVTPEGVFPFLTSNTWMRLIAQNSAQKLKEAQKTRPPPTNQDPAAAWRHVASVATLGKCWYNVLRDAITVQRASQTGCTRLTRVLPM